MNSLWDIRIFLGLVPKESLCTYVFINFIKSFDFPSDIDNNTKFREGQKETPNLLANSVCT